MYYETPKNLTRVWTNAMALRSLPTDLATTERSPVDMERTSEKFRRLSAEKMGTMGDGKVRRPVEAVLRKLFGAALLLAIGMVFVPADATARSPITCGTAYTVASGDTLFNIARRAFGNGKLYKQIFKANREILPNSASIEIGTEILIPCLDSSGKAVREDVVAQKSLAEPGNPEATKAASEEPAQANSGLLRQAVQLVAMATMPMQSIAGPVNPTASPASIAKGEVDAIGPVTSEPQLVIPRVRLLTGSGIAPYADENLPRGGMITNLVSRALNAAAPGQKSRVAFVNDWASHLNYLLPEGAFDVSFPWYKPDCSKADKLNAEMQKRCAEFQFSNPIFEVRVGFYTQAGNALVETGTLAALSGKRLCHPSGHFTFDLEQIGLVEPNVSIETQYTSKECFVRLVKGQVDVVALDKSEGDEQLRQLGIAKAITEIGDLESVQTLHALVSKQNPNGLDHLELINRGLVELMASGKWFEVVASHQGRQLALMN
jgi:polar amino acid transport system substrate-binding protein